MGRIFRHSGELPFWCDGAVGAADAEINVLRPAAEKQEMMELSTLLPWMAEEGPNTALYLHFTFCQTKGWIDAGN